MKTSEIAIEFLKNYGKPKTMQEANMLLVITKMFSEIHKMEKNILELKKLIKTTERV